jgi:hypothetical protein
VRFRLDKQNEELGWTEAPIDKEYEKLRTEIYNFQFPKMHLHSHITQSIRQMGSPDNLSTDMSEILHIEMVKEA